MRDGNLVMLDRNMHVKIDLDEAQAHFTGDGVWVLYRNERNGNAQGSRVHSFGLSEEDRTVLLGGNYEALTIPLEDGHAEVMGDGTYVLCRVEVCGHSKVHHSIAVTCQDLEAMQAA